MLPASAQSDDSRTMTVIARDGRKRNIKIGLSEDASRPFQLGA